MQGTICIFLISLIRLELWMVMKIYFDYRIQHSHILQALEVKLKSYQGKLYNIYLFRLLHFKVDKNLKKTYDRRFYFAVKKQFDAVKSQQCKIIPFFFF